MIASYRARSVLIGLVLSVLGAAAFPGVALAQRGGGGRGSGGSAPSDLTRLETLEAGFKLTKDQKSTVKKILDDAHKNAAPVRDALTKARAAITAAIQANKPQADIDAAVGSYAEQAAAMTALEMKALAQVLQAREAGQRANAAGVQSAFFLMRGIFLDSKKWDDVPDGRGY